MRKLRPVVMFMLALAALCLSGCLELVGQRITIRYDQAKDQLHVLLHYDGIHDSGNDQFGNGAQQVAAAVKQGNFMILDWPAHVRMDSIREMAANPQEGVQDAVQQLIKTTVQSLKVEAVGHFRDPQGHIGGVQKLTISNARKFIGAVNAAISAAIRDSESEPDEGALTIKLIRAAAVKGHHWLALEGNALVVRVPVHAREFAYLKAKALLALPGQANGQPQGWTRAVQMLAATPLTFSEADGMVTIRIGDNASSSTLRLLLGKAYQANLEQAVLQEAGANVDALLAAQLLTPESVKPAPGIDAIRQWGPPEATAAALWHAATGDDAALRTKAIAKLKEFSARWNANEALPIAPQDTDDVAAYLEAWRVWYRQAVRFPLPDDADTGNE